MGCWVTEPAQKERPHKWVMLLPFLHVLQLSILHLVSGWLTQDPVSLPERTLRFQREDMGV